MSKTQLSWPTCKFGDIADFRNGLNFTQASRGQAVKVVGVGNFGVAEELGDFSATTVVTIDGELSDEDLLKDGDLLFVRSNGNKALVGRCVYVQPNGEKITFSGFTIRARITSTEVDRRFISKVVRSPLFKEALYRLGGGSSINNLSQGVLSQFEFPLPPLPEQRRIAEVLLTWDESIKACERLIAGKKSRIAAVRQSLFSSTRPGAEPDTTASWDETTLGSIFVESNELNPGLGPDSVITVGKYAIRRQVEHFTRSVASTNLSNYQLLKPGDFVYDPMSAYYGAIGRYTGLAPGIVSPAYTVIRLTDDVAPGFVEGLLKSHYIAFELENRSSQGNREGKRRILRSDEFSSISFMLPPRREQDRIAHTIAEVSHDLNLTIRSREALLKQKRGLMQKLLTGEWRVKPGDGDA